MGKEVQRIPGELTDIDVDFLSLVRKGANKQTIQIYKADEADVEPEPDGVPKGIREFFTVLKSFFCNEPLEKADTAKKTSFFTGRMAVVDVLSNLYQVEDVLRETMRTIIADDSITDKKAAMTSAVNEFAAYMQDKISTSAVAKSADFYMPMKGEQDMNMDDLKKAITEAVSPLAEKLETLEKQMKEAPASGTPEVELAKTSEDPKVAIVEALKPLTARLAALENARGVSKSEVPDDQMGLEKSEADLFDGYFI